MNMKYLTVLILLAAFSLFTVENFAEEFVFGEQFKALDNAATGEWWKRNPSPEELKNKNEKNPKPIVNLNVERDKVVAFALYTHDDEVLKLTGQLYPLMPDELLEARLEVKRDGEWLEIAKEPVQLPGWSAHFRIANWDATKDVAYRVRHGAKAMFEGLIRHDPIEKNEILVGNLSCNSSRTPGERPRILKNLKLQDPDLLFFAGDQTYHHTQHTAGWIEFGLQFREVMKDRPTITIPDDHDVGQGNLWGQGGRKAMRKAGDDGGFYYPAKYVNQVQRCQTWHLPEPYDATPLEQGITVYYTRLRVGGIDFAILEDRKFKSGPQGKIPQMGPRPDHIRNPEYRRESIDLPGLVLLGDRQLKFLNLWGQDWTGAEMKCVLSQTAFCGAVHLHGSPENRLLADLDSNAWPQTGRKKALIEIRRAWAPHLCGDQHLAVTVKHGIDEYGDGPFGFTSPALVNTIYGRWWHPIEEKPGPNAVKGSPLPWTGDYEDGLGNKITMLAYANPPDRKNEQQRADGYGMVRFNKSNRTITFECWPRFSDVSDGDSAQFPGWPLTINMKDNDGRKPVGYLPRLDFENATSPVVQVVDEATQEILYTVRVQGKTFRAPVYAAGTYTVKAGTNSPERVILAGSTPAGADNESKNVSIDLKE